MGIANGIARGIARGQQNKNVLQEVSSRSKDKDTDKIVAIARKRKKPELTPEESEVLSYLNLKADNSFTAPGEIGKRLAEGHTVEECKIIIDKKVTEWLGTDFAKNLNPTTLFRLCHFDAYLHQKGGINGHRQAKGYRPDIKDAVFTGENWIRSEHEHDADPTD